MTPEPPRPFRGGGLWDQAAAVAVAFSAEVAAAAASAALAALVAATAAVDAARAAAAADWAEAAALSAAAAAFALALLASTTAAMAAAAAKALKYKARSAVSVMAFFSLEEMNIGGSNAGGKRISPLRNLSNPFGDFARCVSFPAYLYYASISGVF